jgi:ribosomal protein S11
MRKVLLAVAGLAFAASVSVAQDVVSFIHGTVKKVDSTTKTIVVKTKDGTDHTIKVAGDDTVKGTKDGFNGIKEGSEVVVSSTGKGADATAKALGKVGKDGMKVTKGTIEKVDDGTKTVVVKSADGTEKTFEYSGTALADSGKDIAKGTEKGAKVTVYYTEDAGKKIVHFFE